ncbi:MAG TPA: hypothetical protein VHI13_20220 [Candidatus Kapabacteria bacterium]|nr:hypothetical protein [Candidatus Kapabacteria bacterium]
MNYVVNIQTKVNCPHQGSVQYVLVNPRLYAMNVKVVGASIVTKMDKYPLLAPPCPNTQTPPCVEVIWNTQALRVKVRGSPIILFDSVGLCSPPQLPKTIPTIQQRVKAT